MTTPSRDILQRYVSAGGANLFLRVRWHLTPYGAMSAELPRSGRILDLGCGHGLLALALALEAPERQVLGIDHDEARVALARQASANVPNLRFEKGDIAAPQSNPGTEEPFAGVAMIDVMHYFDPAQQERMIASVFGLLEKGGTLILREVNPDGGLASKWNRLYEKLATATGFTRTRQAELHFRAPEQWKRVLREAGFLVSAQPCSHFLFADILYVCKKAL